MEQGRTEEGASNTWMRQRLSDSVYLWACGEKATNEDGDPKLSDMLIGWIILFVSECIFLLTSSEYTGLSRPFTGKRVKTEDRSMKTC